MKVIEERYAVSVRIDESEGRISPTLLAEELSRRNATAKFYRNGKIMSKQTIMYWQRTRSFPDGVVKELRKIPFSAIKFGFPRYKKKRLPGKEQ